MSAIAGVLQRNGGTVHRALLRCLGRSMSHRGPDGSSEWASGHVGLGNRLLKTSPGQAQAAHVSVPDERTLHITFDGRIDNARELRATLHLASPSTSAAHDSAIVLEAYKAWGEECPVRLRGDFAFALWDERRQSLFCARDGFGSRPLYYSDENGRFAFASELRALRRIPDTSYRINEGRIADYLVGDLEGVDKVSTPFTDIHRLPPGHSMTVAAGRTTIRRYWSPDPVAEIRRADPDEYAHEFLHLLSQAVARCAKAEDPVSVMLSGGLDSAAIAALAGRFNDSHNLGPLHTVSGVNPADPACLESRFIRMASGFPGVHPHHVTPAEVAGMVTSVDRLLYDADEYFDSWSMHIPLTMYARAQQLGCRVMLDGVDGDIVASLGRGYLACLLREGHWATAGREAHGLAADTGIPGWQLLCGSGRGLLVPRAVRRLWRQYKPRPLQQMIAGSIVNQDFALRVDVPARFEAMHRNCAPQSNTVTGIHAAALNAPYMTVALERYDRLASYHSIEARHPLFDRDLVDFCLSLPWDQKRRDGRTKWGLRSALESVLPHAMCWRTDCEHLGPQFLNAWFALKRDEMRDFLARHLHEIEDYVSVPVVRQAHAQFEKTGDVAEGFKVWQAFSLWCWLERNA
jgi:asparagine synthase (glutamine-hydrolysing)